MSAVERVQFLDDILNSALLTGALVFDKRRQVVGVRLCLHGLPAGQPASSLLALLHHRVEAMPRRPLFVSLPGARIDPALTRLDLPSHVVVEVPADAAADPDLAPRLETLAVSGKRLAVAGLPPRPIPALSLCRFEVALVPASLDRRLAPTKVLADRTLRFFVTGATTLADVNAAFDRGAAASVGWPVGDPVVRPSGSLSPAQSIVLELLRLLRDDAPLSTIESVLKRDTAIAYALLKLVNNAAAGLPAPVSSFQQALKVLGQARLQRWLVFMLSVGSGEADARPLAVMSSLRGLLLDGLTPLVAGAHRDGLFATGAFSLLDRITGTAAQDLIRSVGLDQAVGDAVEAGTGPLGPFLAIALANETGDPAAVRRALAHADMPRLAYNSALLQSLADVLGLMDS